VQINPNDLLKQQLIIDFDYFFLNYKKNKAINH